MLRYNKVTLRVGGRELGSSVLGCTVEVGAGAKILGKVQSGSYAKIGANAVVIDNVPEGATVIGISAYIHHISKRSSTLMSN
jgi:serine O-acetyltransferase